MVSDHAPYFSIVMPTRNRGHLLPYALQSALDQTFRDYEIVWLTTSPATTPRRLHGRSAARECVTCEPKKFSPCTKTGSSHWARPAANG